MEEDTIELIDYLRVIWKRKILIIVVILVCIGVGAGVVMNSKPMLRLPVTYRADAVVKVGKKVKLVPASSVPSSVVSYIEDPGVMLEAVPLKYASKLRDMPEYQLEIERIGSSSMLRLIMTGPDKEVERILKELVDRLINEHRIKANDSVVAYKDFMKRLEVDAKELRKEIAVIDTSVKEMKNKEYEHLIHIDTITKEDRTEGDRSAFANMLYLKTIDKENSLNNKQATLRDIQMRLIMHQITLGNLEEYKTEMFGKIRNTAIKPEQRENSKYNTIAIAGVAGLIMSLFIAFLVDYVEDIKVKEKRKRKRQG